jgi:hypothetical protein
MDKVERTILDIFEVLSENIYLKRYFNLQEFIKNEILPELEMGKKVYNGDTDNFRPLIENIIEKVYLITNKYLSAKFLAEIYYEYEEEFNQMFLTYVS